MGFFDRLLRRKKAQLVFSWTTVDLYANIVRIGRENQNGSRGIHTDAKGNVWISTTPLTQQISRRHAELHWDRRKRRYIFVDVGSKYGSEIKGMRVSPGNEIVLKNGDKIRLGAALRCEIIYV